MATTLDDWDARAARNEASAMRLGRAAAPGVGERNIQRGSFSGSGSEYFGIWIVNLILSVLTLGIYTAWAKVRNERYFKGHTYVAGHNFDYHAKPTTILKGRVIAFAAFFAFNFMAEIAPIAALVLLGVYLAALPFLIVRGVAFNARMTSHRNVRFGFKGRKRDALMAFVVWPILGVLSSGLLWPFVSRSTARFLGNHRYGTANFHVDPPVKNYYAALLWTLPIIAGGAVIMGLAFGGIQAIGSLGMIGPFQFTIILLGYAAFFLVPTWYHVLARNITVSNATLDGGHRFVSDMKPLSYFAIVVSNGLVVVLTLGLATPWAKVRLARYKAEHTGIIPGDDLDGFVNDQQQKGDVVSGEFLDMDGFELGL